MSSLTIAKVTVSQIEQAPALPQLLAEYEAESANSEIGAARPQIETYRGMEAVGMLQALGAYVDDKLVGFLFLLLPVLPHFGQKVGVAESYFVAGAHRKTGAGTQLRVAAEEAARAAGAVGVLISAPTDGVLAQVMPRSGYRETNRVYFKRLK